MVQNHFASVADVKPGPFRQFLLMAVLKIIHILAAVSANQGNLSGITSIHFARLGHHRRWAQADVLEQL